MIPGAQQRRRQKGQDFTTRSVIPPGTGDRPSSSQASKAAVTSRTSPIWETLSNFRLRRMAAMAETAISTTTAETNAF